jgi:hypothetical protein
MNTTAAMNMVATSPLLLKNEVSEEENKEKEVKVGHQDLGSSPTFGMSSAKGQLISKCPFGVFNLPKNQQKNFQDFCPSLLKEVKSKKIRALYTANWIILLTLFLYFFDLTSF